MGCCFLLWWILNVARARCLVEFLSASNRPELFVLVPPLVTPKWHLCEMHVKHRSSMGVYITQIPWP